MFNYLKGIALCLTILVGSIQLWEWFGDRITNWWAQRSLQRARERLSRLEKRYYRWDRFGQNPYLSLQYLIRRTRWGFYLLSIAFIQLAFGLVDLSHELAIGEIPLSEDASLPVYNSTTSFGIAALLFFVAIFVIVKNSEAAAEELAQPEESREKIYSEIADLLSRYPELKQHSEILESDA